MLCKATGFCGSRRGHIYIYRVGGARQGQSESNIIYICTERDRETERQREFVCEREKHHRYIGSVGQDEGIESKIVYIYMCSYIYIYIYRERERE